MSFDARDPQTLLEAMASRRSVRRFTAEHPGRQRIERLIALAITAPSASNQQPWRFFIADQRLTIDRMVAASQAAVEEISATMPAEALAAFRAYGDYFTRFQAAPVVIALACRGQAVLSHLAGGQLPAERRAAIAAMEEISPVLGGGMALQNLLLAASAGGLGASCLTGPLIAMDEIARICGIPAAWRLTALVALGFPDEQPEATPRKRAEQVIRWVDDHDAARVGP